MIAALVRSAAAKQAAAPAVETEQLKAARGSNEQISDVVITSWRHSLDKNVCIDLKMTFFERGNLD